MALFTAPIIISLGTTALLAFVIGALLLIYALADLTPDRRGFIRNSGFILFLAGLALCLIFVAYSVAAYFLPLAS